MSMSETGNIQDLRLSDNLELLAKQVVEGFITGLHKSPFHGFSVEFAEHRLYNEGESTKHIDWKLYGRSDKMFVKRYEEETNLRCQIIIDNSSSMYFPLEDATNKAGDKLTFAVQSTAVLTYLLKKQRDAFGLSVFSDHVELHTETKSNQVHQRRLMFEMEKMLSPGAKVVNKSSAVAAALHEIAERIHKRSLVIIFSDMFGNADGEQVDEMFNALQHLKHNKHEVILFHVVDKSAELDFKFENRPYRFVDVETGEEVKVHANQVREAYIKKMSEFMAELKLRCGQFRIELVEADIKKGFRQVLIPYLIKRQKMK